MTAFRIIVILFVFAALGCHQKTQQTNDSEPATKDSIQQQKTVAAQQDTTNQDIYEFMKVVIANQNLDLSYGLSVEPEQGCDLSDDDSIFLKTLLPAKSKHKEKTDTGDWRTMTVDPFELPKCLTKSDIAYMLSQKQNLSTFKWDNSRLSFNSDNKKNWYAFSIPLFSKDRRKVVMMIRNLCPGLCGTGWTVLFIKEDNRWTSQSGAHWIH
jgi:hypothetical protein